MGFPIRTSPDHSSVVNFPGLIADSYVLLRLLMPRHPPCALSSLSLNLNKKLLQRCSRPLCSSQGTGGTCPDASRTRELRAVRRRNRSEGRSAEALDPSGPNNVPGACRPTVCFPLRPAPRCRQVVLANGREDALQIVDVPLNEQCCPETNARETAHGQVARRLPANCSLERR